MFAWPGCRFLSIVGAAHFPAMAETARRWTAAACTGLCEHPVRREHPVRAPSYQLKILIPSPQELMAHCRQQRRLFNASPPYERLVA